MSTSKTQRVDTNGLIEEITRYLATVELFRTEGHEPRWQTGEQADTTRVEQGPSPVAGAR